MKLSASTLGCLKWDLPTILARLREYGFDGIDFRGLGNELKLWLLPEFATMVADTAARIHDHGLAVSCISSGVLLTDTRPGNLAAGDEEIARTAEICAALGCSQIRVFGGSLNLADGATEADRPRLVNLAAERATALAERARAIAPVDLLIETHDAWTSSAHMAAVLERVNRDDVACCWDVKHTYWTGHEVPEVTWQRLGRWVRTTHWKDGRRCLDGKERFGRDVRDSGLLCTMGEGVIPLADCQELLATVGYDGWHTLEWEKRWHPHIEEPEVAFPQFVRYLRNLEERLAQ